jgi:hypothetical protein
MEKLQGPFSEKQEKLYKVIYSKNGHGTMTVMSAIPTAYVTPPSFHWGINSSGEEVFRLPCQPVMHCLLQLLSSDL